MLGSLRVLPNSRFDARLFVGKRVWTKMVIVHCTPGAVATCACSTRADTPVDRTPPPQGARRGHRRFRRGTCVVGVRKTLKNGGSGAPSAHSEVKNARKLENYSGPY